MSKDLATAKQLCVEIGLGTYGRKPYEMQEKPQWWKLQKIEALVREIRQHIEKAAVDLAAKDIEIARLQTALAALEGRP